MVSRTPNGAAFSGPADGDAALVGPVELDHYQIAEKLSATLGRPFHYEPLSIPQFVTEMQSSGLSPRFIQHIASVAQDYQDGIFAGWSFPGFVDT